MRWRAFSGHIVDLAEALGVQVVVSLGALLGDVPHTRPVAISGHASDPALMERLGHAGLDLRGPDGDRRRAAQRLRAGRAAVGEPVGGRAALRRRRRQPEGRARARAPRRRADRRVRRRLRARVRRRRLRAPGRARRAERSRHPGVRRTARAGRRERRGRRARGRALGDAIAREFQRFLRQRGASESRPAQRSGAATSRRPGRRSGSRRSSTPRARASARTPARGCPRRPPARGR